MATHQIAHGCGVIVQPPPTARRAAPTAKSCSCSELPVTRNAKAQWFLTKQLSRLAACSIKQARLHQPGTGLVMINHPPQLSHWCYFARNILSGVLVNLHTMVVTSTWFLLRHWPCACMIIAKFPLFSPLRFVPPVSSSPQTDLASQIAGTCNRYLTVVQGSIDNQMLDEHSDFSKC